MKSKFLNLKTFKHSIKIENLKFKIIVFSLLLFIFLAPQVSAQSWWPLVPCGRTGQDPCTRCDLFRLTDNVIHFILEGIIPPVAAVLFIAAGLIILLAGARPEWVSTGRAIFWRTFIGLVIIFASWLVVNTLIKSFGPEQATGTPWYRFTCKDGVITPGGPPPSALCSDPSALAARYGTSSTIKNAPELDVLISCVNSRLGSFIDQSQIYTYERQNDLCNYTRGNPVCGICAHQVNSCHYGGASGATGAQAVDFNAQGISEQDLSQRLQSISGVCNFGFILFEGNNTHVSTQSCTGN